MSADESALLAAVAADPAADLPRLVYADWLDDHGQPIRAEFIRLQCEIARLEVGPRALVDANWRLWKRQQDLLDDHLPELLGPADFLADDKPVLRRGFVDDLELRADRLESVAAALFEVVIRPTRLTVTECTRFTIELGETMPAVLDWVTRIVAVNVVTHEAIHCHGHDGEYVRRRSGWPRVSELDLTDADYGSYALGWLADGAFPTLRHLDLSNNSLSDAEVVELLNLGVPSRLTRLVLDSNPLTDQSAFELADRLARVKTFRTLDIRRTQIGQAGQLALTSAFGSRCNLF